MARYFTSDLHFGHENIIRYSGRPYDSVDEMNADIVERINAIVSPDDDLFNLGDVVMGRRVETLKNVALIDATQHLISGNHDGCWGGHRKKARAERAVGEYLEAGFATVQDSLVISLAGRQVLLSHLPYAGDHTDEDRYADRRPVDRGSWLICGHVHEKWRQRGRQINVGIDAWAGNPVSEKTLIELIEQGPADRDRLDW